MIEFSSANNLYKINGFTTNNEVFKSNRNTLIILVNSRIVKNLNIQYAITDAYQTILPVGKHPITVLNISCDYDLIDVNVHPAKLEIRFTDEEELRKLITSTIKKALHDSELLKYTKSATQITEVETNKYPHFENSNASRAVFEQSSFEIKNKDDFSYESEDLTDESEKLTIEENDDFDWINEFDEKTPVESNINNNEVFDENDYIQPKLIEDDERKFFYESKFQEIEKVIKSLNNNIETIKNKKELVINNFTTIINNFNVNSQMLLDNYVQTKLLISQIIDKIILTNDFIKVKFKSEIFIEPNSERSK